MGQGRDTAGLFHPHQALPCQFFAQRNAPGDAERRLLAAIVALAVEDLARIDTDAHRAAWHWIFGEPVLSQKQRWSFVAACEALALDVDAARAALLTATNPDGRLRYPPPKPRAEPKQPTGDVDWLDLIWSWARYRAEWCTADLSAALGLRTPGRYRGALAGLVAMGAIVRLGKGRYATRAVRLACVDPGAAEAG